MDGKPVLPSYLKKKMAESVFPGNAASDFALSSNPPDGSVDQYCNDERARVRARVRKKVVNFLFWGVWCSRLNEILEKRKALGRHGFG